MINPEPTPNANGVIEVIAACNAAAETIARQIVSKHPQMDVEDIACLVSAELFYTAQDTAQACDAGVRMQRA